MASVSNLRNLIEAWRKADGNEVREAGFTLSTNAGSKAGAPEYSAESDPHLRSFFKRNKIARGRKKLKQQLSMEASVTHNRPGSQRKSIFDNTKQQSLMIQTAVSADHVLAIKEGFWRWSSEIVTDGCRSTHCAVHAAGVQYERLRVVNVAVTNMHAVVRTGISLSNNHRARHQRLPLPIPSPELLCDWLHVLNGTETVDWSTFLILCTVDLTLDWAVVANLKASYDGFVRSHGVQSEADYHALLSFLFWQDMPRNKQHGNDRPPSFFQSGDFYRARHLCNFAEVIISLLPHQVQHYITKANGRGTSMFQNFCGHTAPGSVSSSPPPSRATGSPRPHSAMATAMMNPHHRLLLEQSKPKTDAVFEHTKALRYVNRVFCI